MILRPPRSTRTDTLFPDTTLFRSLVLDHRAVDDARGIGKRRELPKGANRRLDSPRPARSIGDIQPHEYGLAPAFLNLSHDLVAHFDIQIGDDDLSALLGKKPSLRWTQAARRARYEHMGRAHV